MNAFAVYWRAYGGWREIIWSPYFFGAANFWIWCKPIWGGGQGSIPVWTDWALSLLSSLLAFSLGAVAIFLAFSNGTFLAIIRNGGDPKSYFMTVVSAFFHFILVQFFALALMIVFIGYSGVYVSALAFFFFSYAMSCGVAAAAALVDTADIINQMGVLDPKLKDNE